uniref:Ig-like domain-containing protein n=1 Tax=Sparus aurata TaxID=8175 RepID=A0A671UAG4_SPAAU
MTLSPRNQTKFNILAYFSTLYLPFLFAEKDGCMGPFDQTAYTAAKTTITCHYPGEKNKSSVKFFCKNKKLICEDILSTQSSSKSNGKFTLTETSSGFSISISNVSKGDAGVYWCGAETSNGRYRAALRSIQLKVEGESLTAETFCFTHTSGHFLCSVVYLAGGSYVLITVTVSVAVLLLFVLILIFIYKSKRLLICSQNRKHKHVRQIKPHSPSCTDTVLFLHSSLKDYIYAEIQEPVQNPDSGDAVNTVYATANCPTNPSASLHYSTITFKNCSKEAGGDELIVKPRSACEYSTVNYSVSSVYSTVNNPSVASQDPLYSAVTNKQ